MHLRLQSLKHSIMLGQHPTGQGCYQHSCDAPAKSALKIEGVSELSLRERTVQGGPWSVSLCRLRPEPRTCWLA